MRQERGRPMFHVLTRPAPHLGRFRALMLAAGIGASLAFAPLVQAEAQDAAGNLVQMPSLSPLIKKVLPSVVYSSLLEKADAVHQYANEAVGGNFQGIPPCSPFDEFLK